MHHRGDNILSCAVWEFAIRGWLHSNSAVGCCMTHHGKTMHTGSAACNGVLLVNAAWHCTCVKKRACTSRPLASWLVSHIAEDACQHFFQFSLLLCFSNRLVRQSVAHFICVLTCGDFTWPLLLLLPLWLLLLLLRGLPRLLLLLLLLLWLLLLLRLLLQDLLLL